jgi:hypothetical protein
MSFDVGCGDTFRSDLKQAATTTWRMIEKWKLAPR